LLFIQLLINLKLIQILVHDNEILLKQTFPKQEK
jgi:hypothetical protein